MLVHLRPHLNHATVVAWLALFVAIGGSAYAVTALPKNSVGTKQLKTRAVTNKKLATGAADGRVVKAGTLGIVPRARNANRLQGNSSSAFLRYGGTIPSGTTIVGSFGGDSGVSGSSAPQALTSWREVVQLPAAAPAALSDNTVNFSPSSVKVGDADGSCTGTSARPSAPRGKVCLYLASYENGTSDGGITGGIAPFVTGIGLRTGFAVSVSGTYPGAGAWGTWAYTAP